MSRPALASARPGRDAGGRFLAGALASALGLAGIGWSVAAYRALPDLGVTRAISMRIGRGDAYRYDALRARADSIGTLGERTCDTAFLADGLLIQARAAENEVAAANLADLDRRFEDVERSAHRLLECAPAQSLGWLALFWARSFRTGDGASIVPLLAESYRTGPNESWIRVRRIGLAMTHLRSLPQAVRKLVLDEFHVLVALYQIELTTKIYARMDDDTRRTILAGLKGVDAGARNAFARTLGRSGIDVDLADLLDRPDRPWLAR